MEKHGVPMSHIARQVPRLSSKGHGVPCHGGSLAAVLTWLGRGPDARSACGLPGTPWRRHGPQSQRRKRASSLVSVTSSPVT